LSTALSVENGSLAELEMVKVSVVTISFNQAEFLERTLRSVLNQDYQNIEYIVVDPGSTDGSRELIESYGSRIARTILEPDAGAADRTNIEFS
jgi:glycosyltransferase involved in cell wall biosynthesis